MTSTEAPIATALAGWRRVPTLAPALADPNGTYLVLHRADGRILHASAAAQVLADALSAQDPAPLVRQMEQAAAGDGATRLARLRLDPRRIAPPVLCLVSAATLEDGKRAILLIPTAPVTIPRPRVGARLGARPAPEPRPGETDPGAPRIGERFLWRSDGRGILTAVTGAPSLEGIIGRSWNQILGTGGAEAVLAALRAGRTFRAASALLHLDGHPPLPVDLSGAPTARGAADFAGFGLIRGVVGLPAAPAAEPDPAPAGALPAEAEAGSVPGRASDQEPEGDPAAPDPIPVVEVAATEAADPSLSTDEHAAFREIARALGARYAGDDEPAAPDAATPRADGGAVMPFPGLIAEAPPAPADDRALLAALPVPALVHRGNLIVAANAALLELTGFADLDALRGSGMSRLFRGRSPETTGSGQTILEAADGRAHPVEVMGGACTWAGAPATCLTLRLLGADDPVRALEAERLAREAQAARTVRAETALDAVEAAVVTLDGEGRAVALNRAAAALFDCDPREVIGLSFVDLFDAACARAVSAAHRDGEGPVTVAGRAFALRLSEADADGRRVAVLDPADRAMPEAGGKSATESGIARSDTALARLDHAFRGPMRGVVDMAGAMLREPYGPLGDMRYRGSLLEIRDAGERMLDQVGELLDLAAIEAGTLKLDPQPLALNEVVAGCVARLQAEAARGRIVLRTSFSQDLGALEADERSVGRAASLVIEHAIRRSAAGGQVIVSTGAAERAEVALRVRDTAVARADPAADPARPDGDGLALPRALVEANGGRLRLAQRADDDGTLVEIILPAKRA